MEHENPKNIEYTPLTKQAIIQSLENCILQSMWDSLSGKDLLGAYTKHQLAVRYYGASESFDYFLEKLKCEISLYIYTVDATALFLASILDIPCEPKLVPISTLKSLKDLSHDFQLPATPAPSDLFPDQECDCLQDDIESIFANLNFNPSYANNIYTQARDLVLEDQNTTEELLQELVTLDPSITTRVNHLLKLRQEAQLKATIEGSRETVSALLDRIFKDLQAIIRSSQVMQLYLEDISSMVCDNQTLSSFSSPVTNKVNILLTLHRNSAKSENSLNRLYSILRYFRLPENTDASLKSFLNEKFTNVFLDEWKNQVRQQLNLYPHPYAQAWFSNLILENDILPEHYSCFIESDTPENLLYYGIKPFVKSLPEPQSPKQEPTRDPLEYFVKK